MLDPWDEDFVSAEEYDDPGGSCRLEACDAESRRASFEAGYGHGYYYSSCPEGGGADGDRYEGYKNGYQAGYDAADLSTRRTSPSRGDRRVVCSVWWEGRYAEWDVESEASLMAEG